MDFKEIDLVVPYVDSSDPEWRELFGRYDPNPSGKEGIDAENRFRGQGDFFRFFFRGIERNMPWVRKIHLLVQSRSQVPAWLDESKVHVVLHDEFIPKEFLPTYNSCTIEMFLWNIPGLSEHFIYSNDDIYAFSRMLPGQFFTVEGDCRNMSREMRFNPEELYLHHCRNSYLMAYCKESSSHIYGFRHSMRPYLKSMMMKCYKEHEQEIRESISMLRESKNVNVYLYDHYIINHHRQAPMAQRMPVGYICSGLLPSEIKARLGAKPDVVVVNDTDPKTNIYESRILKEIFENTLGKSCRFEKKIDLRTK